MYPLPIDSCTFKPNLSFRYLCARRVAFLRHLLLILMIINKSDLYFLNFYTITDNVAGLLMSQEAYLNAWLENRSYKYFLATAKKRNQNMFL